MVEPLPGTAQSGNVSESERVLGGRPMPVKSGEVAVMVTIRSPTVTNSTLGDVAGEVIAYPSRERLASRLRI